MEARKPVRPWDLFNKNKERVLAEVAAKRLEICKGCEFFIGLTSQCVKCGCIMTQKTKLADAFCPVHKWEVENVSNVDYKAP